MGFQCEIAFNEIHLDTDLSEGGKLLEWLVPVGEIVTAETALALVVVGGVQQELCTKFRCLIERTHAEPGDVLFLGTPLLQVQGEGEEIPSGFKYCFVQAKASGHR